MGSDVMLPKTGGVTPLDRIIDEYGVDDIANSAKIEESDSEEDFRESGGGGKKRKGHGLASPGSAIDDRHTHDHEQSTVTSSAPRQGQLKVGDETIPIFPPAHPKNHSNFLRIGLLQRNRFLRRKAALITLYLDAQAIILAGNTKISPKPTFPDVPAFEKLLPALEYVNVGDWAPDQVGWKGHPGDELPPAHLGRRRGFWRTNVSKRHREREARTAVVRGGWAPEGSFEFENECKSSKVARQAAKDRAALQKLIVDLKAIVLSSPTPPPPLSDLLSDDAQPSKTKRRIDKLKGATVATKAASKPLPAQRPTQDKSTTNPSALANDSAHPEPESQPMSKAPSIATTDSKETHLQTPSTPSIAPSGPKKKPKKKKRSVLANQGNPHHVDNYRSTRLPSSQGDPYEPYPSHANLLFPPPMKFLAARPQRKTAPLPGQPASDPVRPAEDEFTCCFCYYALYFGSEKLRRWAVRARRREIKRKDAIKQKAKNVAEGKGMKDDEEDDYDDEDESCDDDDDHDERCTCGRAINRRRARTKPPDKELEEADPLPVPPVDIPDVDSLD